MNRAQTGGAAFAVAVILGTLMDAQGVAPPRDPGVMTADLHVHPFPGDGALAIRQLKREARRRGIDVIAITAHNNQLALRLALGRLKAAPTDTPRRTAPVGSAFRRPESGDRQPEPVVIVLPGQEITAPDFHMIAAGIDELVDWRLSAIDAAAEIHRQGGIAIAAHPVEESWRPLDGATFAVLDGAELAHPMTATVAGARAELDGFFASARGANPGLAPIGSTDFHMTAPLGRCRTYLLVEERSVAGALDALRRGAAVAQDQDGRLFGRPEHVERIEALRRLQGPAPGPSGAQRGFGVFALVALGVVVLPRRAR